VPSVRLSSVLGEEVDLLKIDIEGSELEVLEEARDHLGWVKRIFVEVHRVAGVRGPAGSVIKLLEDAGFHCVAHTVLAPTRPFLTQEPGQGMHDFLINVYGVRRDVPARA
jgi:hypothetical protein